MIEFYNTESINFTFWTRYYYDAGNKIRKLTLVNTGGGIPDLPNWDDVGNIPIYEPEGEGGEGGWSLSRTCCGNMCLPDLADTNIGSLKIF